MRVQTVPDKYERFCGLKNIERKWVWNVAMQCWEQTRNYPIEALQKIYDVGYRQDTFRGESIDQAFDRIINLPYGKSENRYRVLWFVSNFKYGKLLDIGTGLGVFPHLLKTHSWKVEATEPNVFSKNFVENQLGIKCYLEGVQEVPGDYDVISAIHVLEHIPDVNGFLQLISNRLKPNGRVFIEVPDAVEFEYLPADSDEFNSCHIWFFDVSSLYRAVSRCFRVDDIHRVRHKATDRSRIFLSATKQP